MTPGAVIIWAGLGFGLLETAYFGWNWSPQSPAEFAADCVAMGLVAIGLLIKSLG